MVTCQITRAKHPFVNVAQFPWKEMDELDTILLSWTWLLTDLGQKQILQQIYNK